MKHRFIFLTTVLALMSMVVCAQKTQAQYVKVNKERASKLAGDVLKKRDDIGDKKLIPWHVEVINEVFDKYFKDKSVSAKVYEEAHVGFLHDSIETLNGNIKSLNKELASNNVQKIVDEAKEVWRTDSANLEAIINTLNKNITSLRTDSTTFSNKIKEDSLLIIELKNDAAIAEKVVAKLREKGKKLNALYNRIKAAKSLENIDYEQISVSIKEYNDYIDIVQLSVDDQVKNSIDYLNAVARCCKFYKDAVDAMSSKYVQDNISKLIEDGDKISTYSNKIGNFKDEFNNVRKELNQYPSAVKHFNERISAFIEHQGVISNDDHANRIKSIIKLRISEHCGDDKERYSAFYRNLNTVVDYALNNLKRMDESSFEKYVDKIKNDL